jgi:hypothetical protein
LRRGLGVCLRMTSTAIRTFMTGLVDYAGLFPPAALSMRDAVAEYARHRQEAESWGIARFVVPLTRLDEFAESARNHLRRTPVPAGEAAPEPWALSVLLDGAFDQGLMKIRQFNAMHELGDGHNHKHAHSALIDTLEVKIQTPDIIDMALEKLPEDLFTFFEVPMDGDFRGFATALAGTGFGAKLRTGGVVAEAFPPVERVADFLMTFAAAEVPVKCTAGLHHPVRGEYALTYKPDSPKGVMHGFLNVFMAAAMAHCLEADRQTIVNILKETHGDAFKFDGQGASWRSLKLTTEQVSQARENFAICFGSCSFKEPIADLRKLGAL